MTTFRSLTTSSSASSASSASSPRFLLLVSVLSFLVLCKSAYIIPNTSSQRRGSAGIITPSSYLFGNKNKQQQSISLPYRRSSSTKLQLAIRRPYRDDDGSSGSSSYEYERQIERKVAGSRPTDTETELMRSPFAPKSPKILVLDGTGRIGSLVVKQLMELKSPGMKVIAMVRNYDEACERLYGEMKIPKDSRGPTLEIIEADLVPPEELPGFVAHGEEEDEEDDGGNVTAREGTASWKRDAQSAAKFFGNNVEDYNDVENTPSPNEALEEAVKECTTIISCVGTVRRTNFKTDILARPLWRLLRPDVSTWCKDRWHPYYVNYSTTKKTLSYAEQEQRRRDAIVMTLSAQEGIDIDEISPPRIRFVRISDLCVSLNPWNIVALTANIFNSVSCRYQEMTEHLLEDSTAIDTVILRPGDIVDETRNVNTTSVQVCPTGKLPYPAQVGRSDVAALAVSAAMFPARNASMAIIKGPFHYKFACRWAGKQSGGNPPQGKKRDGSSTAGMALKRALRTIRKVEERIQMREDNAQERKRKSNLTPTLYSEIVLRMAKRLSEVRKRRPKAHGICVAIFVYFSLALVVSSLGEALITVIPGGKTWAMPALFRLRESVVSIISLMIARILSILPKFSQTTRYIQL